MTLSIGTLERGVARSALHLLHIAEAQSEPGVEPDRMADDVGQKAVTLARELAHQPSLTLNSLSSQPSLCDNVVARSNEEES